MPMLEEGGDKKQLEIFRRAALNPFPNEMTTAQAWAAAEEALFSNVEFTHPADHRHAIAFLGGAILHVAYCDSDTNAKNLRGVYEFISDPRRSWTGMLNAMLAADHDPEHYWAWVGADGRPTARHPVVAIVATDMLRRDETKRSHILNLALGPLASMPFVVGLEYSEREASHDAPRPSARTPRAGPTDGETDEESEPDGLRSIAG